MSFDSRANKIIEAYNASKERQIRLEERKNALLEGLKNDYNIDSEEALAEEIKHLDSQIDRLNTKIEPMLSALEEQLNVR